MGCQDQGTTTSQTKANGVVEKEAAIAFMDQTSRSNIGAGEEARPGGAEDSPMTSQAARRAPRQLPRAFQYSCELRVLRESQRLCGPEGRGAFPPCKRNGRWRRRDLARKADEKKRREGTTTVWKWGIPYGPAWLRANSANYRPMTMSRITFADWGPTRPRRGSPLGQRGAQPGSETRPRRAPIAF
jgi:hypothetical protein